VRATDLRKRDQLIEIRRIRAASALDDPPDWRDMTNRRIDRFVQLYRSYLCFIERIMHFVRNLSRLSIFANIRAATNETRLHCERSNLRLHSRSHFRSGEIPARGRQRLALLFNRILSFTEDLFTRPVAGKLRNYLLVFSCFDANFGSISSF